MCSGSVPGTGTSPRARLCESPWACAPRAHSPAGAADRPAGGQPALRTSGEVATGPAHRNGAGWRPQGSRKPSLISPPLSCDLKEGVGKSISNMEESVTLDNGGFAALELNSRHLNVKNTFSKKNGTRSLPRPSPGGLHYSDEDLCNKYNGTALTESGALHEKPGDASESEASDSEPEDAPPRRSFVNHYLSDPSYCSSWKRRAGAAPHRYAAAAGAEAGPGPRAVVTTQSAVFAPAARGARAPLTGFSSFV